MQAQCKAVIGDYGIEIVADETYDPKDADMTAQLTKIKGAAGVQAILNPGFGQGPSIVTRNYKQLAIDLPLYQSHGVASDGFIELAGAAGRRRCSPAGYGVAGGLPAAGDDPQKAGRRPTRRPSRTAIQNAGQHLRRLCP
jgi:branched-chain amino acid transport system substrate-binding protein